MSDLGSVKDLVSPDLARKIKAANKGREVLEAGAQQLVNIAQSAFRDPSKRPAVWPQRKSDKGGVSYDAKGRRHNAEGEVSGKPLLIKTGLLVRSIKVGSVSATLATVLSDRPYAPVHQFGSPKKNISPRPFFPFIGNRIVGWAGKKIGDVMKAKFSGLMGLK